ncbi:MAG: phosphoglycerate dehydrogenase [Bacteroidota bacterium]
MRILLTSTSFHDTPGKHHELLKVQNFDTDVIRGPLKEKDLLPVIFKYDAVICGDDEFTREALEAGKNGKLKYISKYGVGLDKIDLKAAKEFGITVTNCSGINQVSVAEHTFALLLSFVKNIHLEYKLTSKGKWQRLTGNEIFGKTLGIAGLGYVGKEVAIRALSFGMNVIAFDNNIDENFIRQNKIRQAVSFETLAQQSDILSLHLPLTKETENIINTVLVKKHMKKGIIIINTARGRLADTDALIWGLNNNIISGYLADVLETEPMPENYALKNHEHVLITPHIASRTYENVEKQGICAVNNLLKMLKRRKSL